MSVSGLSQLLYLFTASPSSLYKPILFKSVSTGMFLKRYKSTSSHTSVYIHSSFLDFILNAPTHKGERYVSNSKKNNEVLQTKQITISCKHVNTSMYYFHIYFLHKIRKLWYIIFLTIYSFAIFLFCLLLSKI